MLRIRAFRPSDFATVRRWVDDPAAASPYPPYLLPVSDDDLHRVVSGKPEPNITRFGVEVDGRLVGEVQSRNAPAAMPVGVFEIGITIWDPSDRGKGYGLEGQRQLIEHLFRDRGAHRVQAGTHPDNRAERRCLIRLGFVEEGTMRDFFGTGNGMGDVVLYGLLKRDWEVQKD